MVSVKKFVDGVIEITRSLNGFPQRGYLRSCTCIPFLQTMSTIPVQLSPTPGFCIKSSSLQPGHLFTSHGDGTSRSSALAPIVVQEGFKIFLNIAWDKNVPPPPDAIQREDLDAFDPDGWVVPVIVSAGREDTDKGQFHSYSSPSFTTCPGLESFPWFVFARF